MDNKKTILVTRELTGGQREYARRLRLQPVEEPAIRIDFPDSWTHVDRELGRHADAGWLFTSRNAVQALKRVQDSEFGIREFPPVYAVGDVTAAALADIGIDAKTPERQDGVGLAERIIRELKTAGPGMPASFIHWCGNRSRDELKELLAGEGIVPVELEVYRVGLNTMRLPENLGEAILFYSPSAVEAFRRSGGFGRKLPALFAIGNTTGEALSLETGENVHIPATPSTEMLLDLVAEILGSRSLSHSG